MESNQGHHEQISDVHALLQAQAELWNYTFVFLKSMALRCAVRLGVPDAIHHHGGPTPLPQLLVALSLPPAKLPQLQRLMRMLASSGLFVEQVPGTGCLDAQYDLTPATRLLVSDDSTSLSPFVHAMLDPVLLEPSLRLSEWFRGDGDRWPTPFALEHGCGLWDVTSRNPEYNTVFNNGMACDGRFVMDVIVKGWGADIFGKLTSLVDVGGGIGGAAKAIAEAFPRVKCTVLDLPQVVAGTTSDGSVEFVAGDMFDHIPPADAVLLKWVLHDWNDQDCVRLLRKCKEAIPPRDAGGKVIIIEMVDGPSSHPTNREVQHFFDIWVMILVGGVERAEHDWQKIFTEAGFSDYKITAVLGPRSVIEVYP